MRHTQAPFTQEQVDSINGYQRSGMMHPFTCGCDHDGERVLVATPEAMVCPTKTCEYRQSWVHTFMADGSWREGAQQLADLGFRVVVDTKPL